MNGILAAGYAEWPIIKQLAQLLGWIMNLIFDFMDSVFGIQNIGICIILFTIIVYTLMIPITIKQQKFTKMSTLMNPEIQKIQKKYEGKRDNVSLAKQQEELQMVYDKYGTSPTGGCLPMLIQFPLLFALYPVIQNIPKYVKSVREVYTPLINEIVASDAYQKIMAAIGSEKPVLMSPDKYDYSLADTLVNALYKFQDATWATLSEKAPALTELIEETVENLSHMNSFLGINISEAPLTIIKTSFSNGAMGAVVVAALIPILSAATQYLSVKISQSGSSNNNKNSTDSMVQSMNTMTVMMPLMSLFLCFTLPAGLGLYWATSAIVRTVQTIGINKYMSKIPVEEIFAKNQEKAAKKREKEGVKAEELRRMATAKTNKKSKKLSENEKEKEEMIQKATAYVLTAPKGTLAYKAASVNRYNTNQAEEPDVVKSEDKKDSK